MPAVRVPLDLPPTLQLERTGQPTLALIVSAARQLR
jgi:hypothetical protein